ncbi:MAG: hypothetical protein KA166_09615 [Saprospiraceae bacterium]|nr:hypothetical protein [Saprospiraceae bacterium]
MKVAVRQNEQVILLRQPVNIGLQIVYHDVACPPERQMNGCDTPCFDHDGISFSRNT